MNRTHEMPKHRRVAIKVVTGSAQQGLSLEGPSGSGGLVGSLEPDYLAQRLQEIVRDLQTEAYDAGAKAALANVRRALGMPTYKDK